jgi:TIR domain
MASFGLAHRPERGNFRYNAFISYSHASDSRLASALRQALHTFAKPWNRLRALNVFLDEANLSADPSLWRSVAAALAQSEFFVLLASPKAARSSWVAKELEYWLQHRHPETILIIRTGGAIVWDQAENDFDWHLSTALPNCLRKVFSEEPRHIDLEWAHSATDLSLASATFRKGVADIAAPLHKRSKDELIGRDLEEQRRRLTVRRRIIIALSVFLALAIGAAMFAIRQRDVAEMQRGRAAQQRDLALSRFDQRSGIRSVGPSACNGQP